MLIITRNESQPGSSISSTSIVLGLESNPLSYFDASDSRPSVAEVLPNGLDAHCVAGSKNIKLDCAFCQEKIYSPVSLEYSGDE